MGHDARSLVPLPELLPPRPPRDERPDLELLFVEVPGLSEVEGFEEMPLLETELESERCEF